MPIAAVLVLMIVVSAVCVYDLNHPEEIHWVTKPADIYEGSFYAPSQPQNSGPHVLSNPCPAEYIAYVEENAWRYLSSSPSAQSGCTIGSPYSGCDKDETVFFFPIWRGDTLAFSMHVYPSSNGELTAVFSNAPNAFLVEAMGKTSPEHPLAFDHTANGDNLYHRDAAAMLPTEGLIVVDTRVPLSEFAAEPEETRWDAPPSLMYEGQRYGTARKPPNYNPDTLEVVAVIESSVEGYELAPENNQSNFGCVGCEICISERNPEYIFIRHTTHDANTSAYKLSTN